MNNIARCVALFILASVAGCAAPQAHGEAPQAQLLMGTGPAPASWKPEVAEPPAIPPTDDAALAFLAQLRESANGLALVMPPDTMTKVLSHRVSLVMSARPALARLKSSTEPSMVVRGWAMEGALAWDLAQAIRDSETPGGLTPEQVGIYREAIDEKADQLENAARGSYRECASFADACRGSVECALNDSAESASGLCRERAAQADQ
jgi:hypothetical protein